MIFATVDIGSNTVRMLIGEHIEGRLRSISYERQITRLAGGCSEQSGLSEVAMNRTLAALKVFHYKLQQRQIPCRRAVGTAALRQAVNQNVFTSKVQQETGWHIDVITGDEEALLTARGVLSVINPVPKNAVIFDIGGGSTELVLVIAGHVAAQKSYPLGVVRLAEEYCDTQQRQKVIDSSLADFYHLVKACFNPNHSFELIGTAGTVTTLAAIHLALKRYDPQYINNHRLTVPWLQQLHDQLEHLTITEREKLPGMEPGRGDLILPGIQLTLAIANLFGFTQMKVSDAGLLEGLFLASCCD